MRTIAIATMADPDHDGKELSSSDTCRLSPIVTPSCPAMPISVPAPAPVPMLVVEDARSDNAPIEGSSKRAHAMHTKKRRRGRQQRPSLLTESIRSSIQSFVRHVGQPRVIEPAGFRDFRGWLSFINSAGALPYWRPILRAVFEYSKHDSHVIHTLKPDIVRDIVRAVVIPRHGESVKLVSTNCGRQCSRPNPQNESNINGGITLMTILDRLLQNTDCLRDDYAERHVAQMKNAADKRVFLQNHLYYRGVGHSRDLDTRDTDKEGLECERKRIKMQYTDSVQNCGTIEDCQSAWSSETERCGECAGSVKNMPASSFKPRFRSFIQASNITSESQSSSHANITAGRLSVPLRASASTSYLHSGMNGEVQPLPSFRELECSLLPSLCLGRKSHAQSISLLPRSPDGSSFPEHPHE